MEETEEIPAETVEEENVEEDTIQEVPEEKSAEDIAADEAMAAFEASLSNISLDFGEENGIRRKCRKQRTRNRKRLWK